MSASCLVVMYHYVRDTERTALPAIRALSPEMFEQQLDWLQERYSPIHPRELEDAVTRGTALPEDAAMLTFDDGFVDHYETVFPALGRRGLSGVFFLTQEACASVPRVLAVHKTHVLLAKLGSDAFRRAVLDACAATIQRTDSVAGAGVFGADRWEYADERAIKNLLNYELSFEEADRVLDVLFARHIGGEQRFARQLYLSEAMVGDMARGGMVFGYHTRSHRLLSRLDAVQQEEELQDGVRWIRSLTKQATVSFCYPWGGTRTYTVDTIRALERLGYSHAFNTVRRRINIGVDGRYELPRLDTRDLPPYTRGAEDAVAASVTDEG